MQAGTLSKARIPTRVAAINKLKSKHMKILSILILSALSFGNCNGQSVQWSKTTNWKIYEGEGFKVFSYPVDTLKNLRSKILETDSIQYYIEQAQSIAKERTPVWMGSYLASYESPDGKTNKVEVSVYGGFFYDQTSGKYFEIRKELSANWMKYITRNIPN